MAKVKCVICHKKVDGVVAWHLKEAPICEECAFGFNFVSVTEEQQKRINELSKENESLRIKIAAMEAK